MNLSEHEIHYLPEDIHYFSENYKKNQPLDDILLYLSIKKKTLVSALEIKKSHRYSFNVFSIEKIAFNKDAKPKNPSFRMGIFSIKQGKLHKIITCPKIPALITPKIFQINGKELQEHGIFDLHFFSFPENCYTELAVPLSVQLSCSAETEMAV